MNKFEVHAEIGESARKVINMIISEGLFKDFSWFKEDRHDDKETFVFSFTPCKKRKSEVSNV